MTAPSARRSGQRISGQEVHALWGGELSLRGDGAIECLEGLSAPVSVVRNMCTGTGIFRRSANAVRRFEQQFHAITFIESGELAIQPSHDAIRLGRNQFMVTKVSTGYQAVMAAGEDEFFDNYTVRVPDHLMLTHFPRGVRFGQPISSQDGPGSAARDLTKYLFAHGRQLGRSELDALTGVLLTLVARAVEGAGAELPARQGPRARHFQAILQLVEQNIADASFSMAAVARKLKLSRRYVGMILREYGLSFRDLVRSHRMELARRLLTTLDTERYPVARISELCGFKSPSHFSSAFKKEEGVTASAYRRNATKSSPTSN